MLYEVKLRFQGRWSEAYELDLAIGRTVELPEEVAAWVNRSRPGTLVPYAPPKPRRRSPRRKKAGNDRQLQAGTGDRSAGKEEVEGDGESD